MSTNKRREAAAQVVSAAELDDAVEALAVAVLRLERLILRLLQARRGR